MIGLFGQQQSISISLDFYNVQMPLGAPLCCRGVESGQQPMNGLPGNRKCEVQLHTAQD